ncbi:hypothetical protein IE53DRAFT_85344 [Violaceomyces palustris]|uniref:Uncharacterized protein n=1 Tax=Violaceomyces palustris TaxID=1673888 RepID=A0ACD0P761_9BASI|nr:hypothetical protein IE53DRAFT_85344 [Violaceomyces palustris]
MSADSHGSTSLAYASAHDYSPTHLHQHDPISQRSSSVVSAGRASSSIADQHPTSSSQRNASVSKPYPANYFASQPHEGYPYPNESASPSYYHPSQHGPPSNPQPQPGISRSGGSVGSSGNQNYYQHGYHSSSQPPQAYRQPPRGYTTGPPPARPSQE